MPPHYQNMFQGYWFLRFFTIFFFNFLINNFIILKYILYAIEQMPVAVSKTKLLSEKKTFSQKLATQAANDISDNVNHTSAVCPFSLSSLRPPIT